MGGCLIVEVPCHAVQAAEGLVGKLAEGSRGEIDIPKGTSGASVNDLNSDGTSLI